LSGIDRFNYIIGMIITGIGSIAIACILKDKFVEIFTNIIFVIALYSLIIYLLCLAPSIRSFLLELSQSYPSLNNEDAAMIGGGKNFIIYNFHAGYISDIIGFSRNCGPFWEPGMFAFFLNLSLFLEVFIKAKPVFSLRVIIQIVALISSFSTGGYVAGIVLMIMYSLIKRKSLWTWILLAPLMAIIIFQVSQLEYIGEKIEMQYNTAEYGSDESRFGAFITQLDMIGNSPIIGGELITDYTTNKTLASGTLLPFVEYGIPMGMLFYILLYKSCRNTSSFSNKTKTIGTTLFLFVIVLSFSQTILLSSTIYLLFYYGLQLPVRRQFLGRT